MRKMILTTLVASAMLATAAAKPALADTEVYLNFGPPAVRYEPVPAVRPGYVWAPGYWDYRGGKKHVWVNGHYVRARPGYVYYAPTWRQDNGRWHLQRERWAADRVAHNNGDRDRDGIPNYADRDRDNDGVRNDRDHAPDNPYRR